MKNKKTMPAKDVLDIYTSLETIGIKIWIDGGWGVDALLGEQTREHKDLDIAIQYKDLDKLREYLESRGYSEVPRDEDKKWNFVLGDTYGHEVDVHAFHFDENGHIVEADEYANGALDGVGTILGQTVRCIAPYHMVQLHTRYEPREVDFPDVNALCKKFDIPVPEKLRTN